MKTKMAVIKWPEGYEVQEEYAEVWNGQPPEIDVGKILKDMTDALDWIHKGQIPTGFLQTMQNDAIRSLLKQLKQELERRGSDV